jgi:2-iminobutanoate/2-iminopropanoate deaminase
VSQEERAQIERDLAQSVWEAPPAYHAAVLPKNRKSQFAVELEVIANSNAAMKKVRHGRAIGTTAALDWPFVEALRCGDVIFTTGQFPVDEAGEILHPTDIAGQARVVMRRLGKALEQAGADLSDLVKIKTYFEGAWDTENWFKNLTARMEMLSDPGPASTGIEGLLPVMAGALLSVDGIAVLDTDANA